MSISLYIHLPFCLSKCSYCDFISYPDCQELIPDYLDGILAESRLYESRFDLADPATIYLGGGTPSLLPPDQIKRLIGAFLPAELRGVAEVTMEANPGTIEGAKLDAFVAVGGTRLSLGLQTHDRELLQVLGRRHTPEDAIEAARMARAAGVAQLNLDVIYGLPGQDLGGWLAALAFVLALEPDHLSVYCLELHPGTNLAERIAAGDLRLPEEDEVAAMLGAAMTVLPAAGLRQYEVTNFARFGAESRHNLNYWHCGDYLGLGAAAHSHLGAKRWVNLTGFDAYLEAIAAESPPVAGEETLRPEQELLEWIMLGLRLREGLPLEELERKAGRPVDVLFGPALPKLIGEGLVEIVAGNLRLTDEGVLLADYVVRTMTGAMP